MFDKDNKAPKFVLTLPDLKEMKKQQRQPAVEEAELASTVRVSTKRTDIDTLEEAIANIPNLSQLKDKPATQELQHLMLAEDMSEQVGSLVLPKISPEGLKPWNEYGTSVAVQPTFKKVALVIKGLGYDPQSMDKIARGFDSEVSLSLTPYAPEPKTKILPARQAGHETYVDLLLSSKNFLQADSGPLSMSITISKEEALSRLRRSLSTGAPIGGVIVNDGIADDDNKELLTALLEELRNRGLLMIDATHGKGLDAIKVDGLARRKADIVIDGNFNRESIEKKLKRAEDIAFSKGQVVVVVDPKPIAVMAAFKWISSFSPQVSYEEARNMELSKPFALVPVSNLVME